MTRRRILTLACTPVVPLLILLLRPMQLDLRQSAVLALLILVILWWVTAAVPRTAASLVLIGGFLLLSGAPLTAVFAFPLSENFFMIVFAFLFSQGIANSGLAHKLLGPVLRRVCTTPLRLIGAMILSALVMIFVIPQPFSRVIVLAGLFGGFFDQAGFGESLKRTLFTGLFTCCILVNCALPRGDIILNGFLPGLSGQTIPDGTWITYMLLPTALYLLVSLVLFRLVFRRELADYRPAPRPQPPGPMSRREKNWLILIAAIVIFWALEGLHGISGTLIVIAGTSIMFPAGLLRLRDFKSVNVGLLIFLTAAFSIGGVLTSCGVADRLFALFVPLFPARFGLGYAAVALLATMVLHAVLGSNITTLSVAVPGLLAVGAGTAPILPLSFLVFTGICAHLVLPFHNVIFLLGEGSGRFDTKFLLRYTIPFTVVAFPAILFFYMGWWQLAGLL